MWDLNLVITMLEYIWASSGVWTFVSIFTDYDIRMNFSQVLWLSVTLGMFSRQTEIIQAAWWNLETLWESRSRLQWLVALWQLQITWQPKLLFLCAYFLWFENNALNYRGTSAVAGTICNLSLTLCSILGGRNASQSKLSVSPSMMIKSH